MHATAVYDAGHQVIFDNLAATYVLFAFNEAVVLRVTDDIRVWKAVIAGILCCDLVHLYASHNALGKDVFWNPQLWRQDDWVNDGTLYLGMVIRSLFLLGVGFTNPKTKKV
jgi:hypothetical protein